MLAEISIPTGQGLALKATFDWLDGFAAGVQAANEAMKDKLAKDLVSSVPPETTPEAEGN